MKRCKIVAILHNVLHKYYKLLVDGCTVYMYLFEYM